MCVPNNTSSSLCSTAQESTTNTGREKNILRWPSCHLLCFIVSSCVCVIALHFASHARGTAVSWLVGSYICWWYRWSTSVITWLNGRHVWPWGRKLLAALTGDSLWTLGSILEVSVATGQNSWPWETKRILPLWLQQTWFRGMLHKLVQGFNLLYMLQSPLGGSMDPFNMSTVRFYSSVLVLLAMSSSWVVLFRNTLVIAVNYIFSYYQHWHLWYYAVIIFHSCLIPCF